MNFKSFINEMIFSAGSQDFSVIPDFSKAKIINKLNGFDVLYQKNNDYNYYALGGR